MTLSSDWSSITLNGTGFHWMSFIRFPPKTSFRSREGWRFGFGRKVSRIISRATKRLRFELRLLRLWAGAMRRTRKKQGLPFFWYASQSVRFLGYALRSDGARPEVWRQKVLWCQRCQIYEKPTRTCGGCGCVVPLKYRFRGVGCWAWENNVTDDRVGWPVSRFD